MKNSVRYKKYTKISVFGCLVSFLVLFTICLIEFLLGGSREYIIQNNVKVLTSSISWLRLPSNLSGAAIFVFLFSGLYFSYKYFSECEKEYRQDIDSIDLGSDFKCDNYEVTDTILSGNALIDHRHSTYKFRLYNETVEIFGDMKIFNINEYGDNIDCIFDGYCIKFRNREVIGVDLVASYMFDFDSSGYVRISDMLWSMQGMNCDKEGVENYFRSLLSMLGDKFGVLMFIRSGVVYLYISCKGRVMPSEMVRTLSNIILESKV